ncbi:exonuclease V-like [Oncorhynchus masou masou]|uniref:exonuclease V-like n=1 Tax=Oncorhynchus masou masou TaxID=90313 RepID=UPI0031831FC1
MNSKTPRDDPLDDGCDISNAQLIKMLSERLAPSDQPSLTPPAGTSLTPGASSLSAGADQHSLTLGVCVVNDGQSLAKKEERLDGQIKKRGHMVVAPFERLSNNRSTVTLSVPDQSPMERFSKHHLNVTQLCEQSWCEIKVVYGFLKPHMKRREMRRTAVTTGASIHLARELEANPDAVTVVVHTREDREALKLINLIQMVPALEAGQLVREFPVLGVLDGVFFLGVVDELYCSKSGDLVLSELKTRSHNSLPHPAQAKGHSLQVGVYKLLFDSMVQGSMKRDQLLHFLKLRPHKAFGSELQRYAQKLGLLAVTFGELVDHLLVVLHFSNLQPIDKLCLEYRHQSSGVLIGNREVEFEETQLRAELRDYLAFWRGEREPHGVDIEDIEEAWKCRMCPYEESCEWRRNRLQEVMVDSSKKAKLDGSKSETPNSSQSPKFKFVRSENPKWESPRLDSPTVDSLTSA